MLNSLHSVQRNIYRREISVRGDERERNKRPNKPNEKSGRAGGGGGESDLNTTDFSCTMWLRVKSS